MKRIRSCFFISAILIGVLLSCLFSHSAFAETCEEWIAKVVSVQGSVQLKRSGETLWEPVHIQKTFCPGDMIRVQAKSRAAIRLINETVLRLDQNTTLTFSGTEKKDASLIDLITGAVHFITRFPRKLKVVTPFVNGTVEGTEFLVTVSEGQSIITVFEGQVNASNNLGSIKVTGGQSVVARAGEAPSLYIMVRPRDAVQWALYYPPVFDFRRPEFGSELQKEWQMMIDNSIDLYRTGDIQGAFDSIQDVPEEGADAGFFIYRASLSLSVGRVDEADRDIHHALVVAPGNSGALSLQSIISLVRSDKDGALTIAQQAVQGDPDSAPARIALSYAQQASFDIDGALTSIQEAIALDPENSLAWARLAELWQSFGDLDKSLECAKKAVALNPDLARTQTVLGFAYLAQIKLQESREAFEKAIELDQADPLPRMGLGLAKIRDGDLREGRMELEIATSLDLNQSLIRSYLGKAYYEEKRDALAMGQYEMARELDPRDPTPFFYDAIRKQSINRPVEALHDMQKAIELNDNRAIYRSKLLLDEDLAARSASLARIYSDLGFQQLALVEGWKSVNTDPGNYSAHRFLADSYSALPRHEIARVSELLQSQLLQPINITPVQPSLSESNLLILDGAGPGDLSFNEFNPLFNRNRIALQISGIAGNNSTWGDEVVISGVHGRASFSIGQFHYETDGFRDNNDLEEDIYNVFAQVSLSHKTSIQAEYRYRDGEEGDLPLRFDRDGQENFAPNLRKENENKSIRIGLRHSFSTRSDVIAHLTFLDAEEEAHNITPVSTLDVSVEDEGYMAEAQYLFSSALAHLTMGIGHFSADREESINISLIQPPIPLEDSFTETDILHTNLYVYTNIHYPKNFKLTIGGSADFFDDDTKDSDQFNPKLGLIWTPFPATTLRAAAFRTLKRTLASNQTIEPTQVAGFNQFFDNINGTDAWRYGVAIDQKFSELIYGGVEYSMRELEVPFTDFTRGGQIKEADWDERVARAYLFWTPKPWLALSAEYIFEAFERDREETGEEQIREVDTHRVPLGISFFLPSGLNTKLRATYINQDGEFGDDINGFFTGDDRFWVVDASIGYRLPKRFGVFTFGVKNLFDEEFGFQDTDLANQVIYPERFIFGRLTLAL